jgi:DNA-binding GntR family transcriptional regulator
MPMTAEWSQTDLHRELAAAIGARDADGAGRLAGRLLGAGVAAVDEWLHTLAGDRRGPSPA